MEQGIILFLWFIKIYFSCGLVFGFYFYFKGSHKIDPLIKDTSKKTQLLFLPGAIILWAFLLPKILKS